MRLFGRLAGFSKPKDTSTNKQAKKDTGGASNLQNENNYKRVDTKGWNHAANDLSDPIILK